MAAFVHAACIHGLELSDVAPRGTVHPGNEIIPCALAIAERDHLPGKAVMAAIAAGYETEIRIGRSLFGPSGVHQAARPPAGDFLYDGGVGVLAFVWDYDIGEVTSRGSHAASAVERGYFTGF